MRQRRSAAGGTAAKSPGALPSAEEIGAAFDEQLSRNVAAAAVRHGLTTPAAPPVRVGEIVVRSPAGFAVTFVRRPLARQMLDFGPSAVVWFAHDPREAMLASSPPGALVRVRPPADASPERVGRLRAMLVEAGAAAVKVLPPAPGAALVPREVEAAPQRGIRETVMACSAKTRSKDRTALDSVLDAALSAEGL